MNKNCISYWYPKLAEAGVPTPRTTIITTKLDLGSLFDDPLLKAKKSREFSAFIEEIEAAAEATGYPVFLRTGHLSAKFGWETTCCVEKRCDVAKHICELVECSCTSTMIDLPTDVWAVREMLPTEPIFTVRHGMPINRERRYFVGDGKVVCHHPYWPEDAVEKTFPYGAVPMRQPMEEPKRIEPEHWREKLTALNCETESEIAELMTLSMRVARQFSGAWSVDWLHTTRGWFCIDMAEAHRSFHWAGCPQEKRR